MTPPMDVTEALDDIHKLRTCRKRPFSFKRFLQSVEDDGMRSYWNIFSIVICWSLENHDKQTVIRELVLAGGDINIPGSCGLSPYHTIILKVLIGHTPQQDLELLEYLIRHGIDIDQRVILNPNFIASPPQRCMDSLTWIQYLSDTIHPNVFSDALPPCTIMGEQRLDTNSNLYHHLHSLLRLLHDPSNVTKHDLWTSFHIDLLRLRWKLSLTYTDETVLQYSRYLFRNRSWIPSLQSIFQTDIVEMTAENNTRMKNIFIVPCMTSPHDLMAFEFVAWNQTYFHKTMVSSLFQSSRHPYTRESIPITILQQWYDIDLPQRPYVRYVIIHDETLQDPAFFGTTQSVSENVFHYLYSLVVTSHPFTNVYRIQQFKTFQLVYLAYRLSRPPFRLIKFHRFLPLPVREQYVPSEEAKDSALIQYQPWFLRICLEYVMKRKCAYAIHHLHFAVEDVLHDISAADRLQTHIDRVQLDVSAVRDVIDFYAFLYSHPDIHEIFEQRVGFSNMDRFQQFWSRLQYYYSLQKQIQRFPFSHDQSSSSPSKRYSSSSSSTSSIFSSSSSSSSSISSMDGSHNSA